MRSDRVIKLPVFRALFTPIARKEWKCDICKSKVTVGKRYVHYIDRRPREIIGYRFHLDCFKLVECYCKEKHRTSFTPRTVRNWIMKTYCEKCNEECKIQPCEKILIASKFRS